MKVKMWLVKYALSSKIKEVEGKISSGGEYLVVDGGGFYLIGRDVFDCREEAVKVAEAAKVKRIASLEKQLQKLKRLTF